MSDDQQEKFPNKFSNNSADHDETDKEEQLDDYVVTLAAATSTIIVVLTGSYAAVNTSRKTS